MEPVIPRLLTAPPNPSESTTAVLLPSLTLSSRHMTT